jgi:hypothetical protein
MMSLSRTVLIAVLAFVATSALILGQNAVITAAVAG